MKKLKLFLIPLLILCITACGKSSEEILKEASDNLNAANSYTMEMEMNIGVSASGLSLNIPVNITMQYDNVNKFAKMEMSMSMMGMDFNTEMYMDMTNENEIITYESTEDEEGNVTWTKTKGEQTSLVTDTTASLDFSKAKKKKDENGDTYYEISVPKEEFNSLMGTTMEDIGGYDLKADPTFRIYVKDGYIVRLYTDLKDAFGSIEENGVEVEITEASLNMDIKEINNTTIKEIPQDIINKAVDGEVLEIQTYAEDYISEIEWDVDYNETTTYTNTTLEYDGPAPESVNVKVVDGYVESGTIKINGYTMTIKDGIVGTPTK